MRYSCTTYISLIALICYVWYCFTVADLVRIPGAADRGVCALQQPQQPAEEPGAAGAAQVAAAQRFLLRTARSVESKVRPPPLAFLSNSTTSKEHPPTNQSMVLC